jgi:putative phage-type endonuclease
MSSFADNATTDYTFDIFRLEDTWEFAFQKMNGYVLDLDDSINIYDDLYDALEDNIYNHCAEYYNMTDVEGNPCIDENKELFNEFIDFMEEVVDVYLSLHPKLRIKSRIQYLQSKPQPDQRTQEWLDMRYNMITASNVSRAITKQKSFIKEKCNPNHKFTGGDATNWGTKFEPVSQMIYEHKFHTKLAEFGVIQHDDHIFIGASPDGINVDETNEELYGKMVEFKSPFTRSIESVLKDTNYKNQKQLQMEVCDLDECDFVITIFKDLYTVENYINANYEYKGVIVTFTEPTDNKKYTYKYMPLFSDENNADKINEWVEEQKRQNPTLVPLADNFVQYWYLKDMSCTLDKRDREWFSINQPHLKECWDMILHRRNNPTLYVSSDEEEETEYVPPVRDDILALDA